MTSKVIYKGALRTEATHIRSGNTIITDAPTDNKGKGEAFSPTDLVATALASCILTIMGIKADGMNINIEGSSAEVKKIMAASPRRIAQVNIVINIPLSADEKTKKIMEKAALTCPVDKSLSDSMIRDVKFIWG
ncbi:MAG: OsmC family protein [Flavobacteriales bacterium]|nr:OsmC family protein [Flavobacteriales bacterium]